MFYTYLNLLFVVLCFLYFVLNKLQQELQLCTSFYELIMGGEVWTNASVAILHFALLCSIFLYCVDPSVGSIEAGVFACQHCASPEQRHILRSMFYFLVISG